MPIIYLLLARLYNHGIAFHIFPVLLLHYKNSNPSFPCLKNILLEGITVSCIRPIIT